MTGGRDDRSGPGPGWTMFMLTQLGTLGSRRFAERLKPLGLTPAHAGLLRAVGQEPGRSQQALAAQLGLLPSRLVALVDELERAGLMERRRHPHDRRHHALHLSAAGEDTLRKIGRIAHQHGQDMLEPLGEQDRAALGQLLGRLAAHHGLTPKVHPGYRDLGREHQRTEAG